MENLHKEVKAVDDGETEREGDRELEMTGSRTTLDGWSERIERIRIIRLDFGLSFKVLKKKYKLDGSTHRSSGLTRLTHLLNGS
jgi:hypothetical protein